MELRDIRYFAAVAEHQNIGRAADALELSPTALSKSLRRLEKSLGAKLVKRSSKGIALTAVGAALLTRIGPLQGIMSDVQREATDLAQGYAGHVNVGVSPGAAEYLLGDACALLSAEMPKVTLKVTGANSEVLRTMLQKGEMDFCVASLQFFSAAEFACERLYEDAFVIFASMHHRLAKRKQITLKDLVAERWATTSGIHYQQWQQLFQAMSKAGLTPPLIALDTNSQAVRIPAIAYSNYLGISSRRFLHREAQRYPLVELPLKEMSHVRNMSILYRKGGYLSPATERLIEIIKTQTREMSSNSRKSR